MASILPVLQRVGGHVVKRVKGSVAPAMTVLAYQVVGQRLGGLDAP
jgi:hypothetical protein